MELYEALGVTARGQRRRDPAGLAEAVARAAPGAQPGRPGGRRPLPRGGARRSRSCRTRSAAPPTTAASCRPSPVAPARDGGFEGFDFSARVRVETVGFRDIFDEPARAAGASAPLPRGEDLEQATRLELRRVDDGRARGASTSCASRPATAAAARGDVAVRAGARARAARAPATVRGSRGPHDLLAPLRASATASGEIRRSALPALRRRGARDRERVARRADPARRRQRQPGAAARRRQRRPARRAARGLRPHGRGRGRTRCSGARATTCTAPCRSG